MHIHTMERSARLGALAADYWEFHLEENPILGIAHGHPAARLCFLRESLADYDRRHLRRGELLANLRQIDPRQLAGQDAISYAMLDRELCDAMTFYRQNEHLRPTMFPFGPEAIIAYAIDATTLASRQDARDYLQRLGTIPQFFADVMERMSLGVEKGYTLPKMLLAPVLANARGYSGVPPHDSVWFKPFHQYSGPTQGMQALADEARMLITEVLGPAYAAYADGLARLYAINCRDSVGCSMTPGGTAYYHQLSQRHTTLPTAPEEIHAQGLAEVARITQAMREVAKATGFGNDLVALRAHLSTSPDFYLPSAEALRERLEVLSKRIDRKIPQWFGTVPRDTYGIESIPVAVAAQMPPAYAQPAPADRKSSGIHWITSLPERCPTYMHVPLALHEAWPGHLMHFALMAEMDTLPAFRRYGVENYTAYVEGWALYCEGLGEEMGFYTDPFDRYGRLDMEMWRATRLVVDTGIHLFGWNRQQAIDFMATHLSLSHAVLATEVDRYIGMPGQALAYKMGEMVIRRLRRQAEVRLGDEFSLRDFHDRLLSAGPLTLPALEQHITTWLQEAAAPNHHA